MNMIIDSGWFNEWVPQIAMWGALIIAIIVAGVTSEMTGAGCFLVFIAVFIITAFVTMFIAILLGIGAEVIIARIITGYHYLIGKLGTTGTILLGCIIIFLILKCFVNGYRRKVISGLENEKSRQLNVNRRRCSREFRKKQEEERRQQQEEAERQRWTREFRKRQEDEQRRWQEEEQRRKEEEAFWENCFADVERQKQEEAERNRRAEDERRRQTQARRKREEQQRRQERKQQQEEARRREQASQKSPYEILGLSPNASNDEIRSQHRKLIAMYHPDKFAASNDPEFIRMASEKFNQVQNAFEEIRRQRGV